MGKVHKRAILIIVLIASALAGTVFALSPAWERYRAEEKQEAMFSRLEISIPEKETAVEPETGGEPEKTAEPVTAKKPERDMPQAGTEIGILSIPEIDACLPVTAGVSEEQLKISEGWVMQTAMIGSEGNAVIAGHRSYTYGKHFNRLGELEAGDEIFYTAADGTEMCFAISEILTVLPDDPVVFDRPPERTSQLTLYTCTPVKVATHRLLIRALRVEE